MAEYIELEAAIEAIMYEPLDAHYPQWYADKIKAIPSADVAPVRNGRWVKRGCKWQCTNCKVLMSIDGTPKENLLNYCHNCGSKMDEEGRFVGICEHCAYREDCEWPKLHPKIKLKECPDFNKGDKK